MQNRRFWEQDFQPNRSPAAIEKSAARLLELVRPAIEHLEACRKEATVNADLLDAFLHGARRMELIGTRMQDGFKAAQRYTQVVRACASRRAAGTGGNRKTGPSQSGCPRSAGARVRAVVASRLQTVLAGWDDETLRGDGPVVRRRAGSVGHRPASGAGRQTAAAAGASGPRAARQVHATHPAASHGNDAAGRRRAVGRHRGHAPAGAGREGRSDFASRAAGAAGHRVAGRGRHPTRAGILCGWNRQGGRNSRAVGSVGKSRQDAADAADPRPDRGRRRSSRPGVSWSSQAAPAVGHRRPHQRRQGRHAVDRERQTPPAPGTGRRPHLSLGSEVACRTRLDAARRSRLGRVRRRGLHRPKLAQQVGLHAARAGIGPVPLHRRDGLGKDRSTASAARLGWK